MESGELAATILGCVDARMVNDFAAPEYNFETAQYAHRVRCGPEAPEDPD